MEPRSRLSRRSFLAWVPAAAALPVLGRAAEPAAAGAAVPGARSAISDLFPTQPPEIVREVVGASHANLERVKEIVGQRPSLARAAWDWGFGDWETALGAASHVGRRDIAEFLIANGARPDIFTAAMLGHLEVVRGFVVAAPGVQRLHGPHGITLMAHARAGGPGAVEVVKYLETLGDADVRTPAEPLDEAGMALLIGTYGFSEALPDRIAIAIDRGALTLQRADTSRRVLVHRGALAFSPVGAERVRIRFEVQKGQAVALTIHDPDLVLTARRLG